MINDELILRIETAFGHVPTAEQRQAMNVFATFATDRSADAAMILLGSAGTGKTTLAAAIVRSLLGLKQKIVLLAPTGRAAKVFSLYAGHPAFTIHRRIYRQKSAGLPAPGSIDGVGAAFNLNDNLHRDTLFIIDEASMISSTSTGSSVFGSGSLLDDLVRYVYNGQNCRMLLIGDKAQLPPVGEDESPALTGSELRAYGLSLYEAELNEVLRQSQESGILYNATMIRQMICFDAPTQLPQMHLRGFADIVVVAGDELIETMASSYSRVGIDDTIVITRSNKRANIYNQGIRNTVLDREEELCRGDQLMVVKNNYYWLKVESEGSFLANGDHCVVQRVRNERELYGLRFADVTLTFPDYEAASANDGSQDVPLELTATVILDTLQAEAPALTCEQQELLYDGVMADYADLPLKADQWKALKNDPHYNALQVKYGYAVTCHKAQGGQWAHVYIDQGYMTDDMLTPDYLHWLYTALTRATEKVFLVNWPKTQQAEE